MAALGPDDTGTFSPTDAPDVQVAVRRTPDAAVTWDRATSRVRFRAEAGAGPSGGTSARLRPNRAGWLDLGARARNVAGVPVGAIMQSPEGPYVLQPHGGWMFEKRPIVIGETFLREGFAVLLSGLRVQEKVVAKATFFLDADRRLAMPAGDASRGGL